MVETGEKKRRDVLIFYGVRRGFVLIRICISVRKNLKLFKNGNRIVQTTASNHKILILTLYIKCSRELRRCGHYECCGEMDDINGYISDLNNNIYIYIVYRANIWKNRELNFE